MARLKANSLHSKLTDHLRHGLGHLFALRAKVGFEAGAFLGDLRGKPAVAEHHRLLGRQQQITAVTHKASQVSHVDFVRHQYRFGIGLFQALEQLLATGRKSFAHQSGFPDFRLARRGPTGSVSLRRKSFHQRPEHSAKPDSAGSGSRTTEIPAPTLHLSRPCPCPDLLLAAIRLVQTSKPSLRSVILRLPVILCRVRAAMSGQQGHTVAGCAGILHLPALRFANHEVEFA